MTLSASIILLGNEINTDNSNSPKNEDKCLSKDNHISPRSSIYPLFNSPRMKKSSLAHHKKKEMKTSMILFGDSERSLDVENEKNWKKSYESGVANEDDRTKNYKSIICCCNEQEVEAGELYKKALMHEKMRKRMRSFLSLLVFFFLCSIFATAFFIYYKFKYDQLHRESAIIREKHKEKIKDFETLMKTQNIDEYYAKMKYGLRTKSGMCVERECIDSAAFLLSNMNLSINPCDDFYEYACGNFITNTIIPDEQFSANVFAMARETVVKHIITLLQRPGVYITSNATQNAKNLFDSCIDEEGIRKRGKEPLVNFINKYLGSWPLLEDEWKDEKNFDIWKQLVHLRQLNNKALIDVHVNPDELNSTNYIFVFSQPDLVLGRKEHYAKAKLLGIEKYNESRHYIQFIMNVANLLNDGNRSQSNLKKDVLDLFRLEMDISQNLLSKQQQRNRDDTTYRGSLGNLSSISSDINWSLIVNNLARYNMSNDSIVIVYDRPYMASLSKILKRHSIRAISNHMNWIIIRNRLMTMPKSFRKTLTQFNNAVSGIRKELDRKFFCASITNNNMGFAVANLYIKTYFESTSKKEAISMIKNIREALKESLERNSWMSTDDKKTAKIKADSMEERIGYPDFILKDANLDEYYKGLNFRATNYFENIIHNLLFQSKRHFDAVTIPTKRPSWNIVPTHVNAYYNVAKNQIIFPAAILQPPFYHMNHPKYLNYGGIGMVIGHEMTHGFDDKGRKFDKDGNNQVWWHAKTVKAFNEKKQCFIDQYNEFCVDTKQNFACVNGIQTQGENIADNGGIKQAFMAYQSYIERLGYGEPHLPGLDLTPNQLFFVNFAQSWCDKTRPKYLADTMKRGAHTPDKFRVYGVVKNSMEFAETFNCPMNSPMNPKKKCILW
ncbi:hypothetical protein SNEBB_010267 [Seison nebaliae]|nr:hypothetical protein SNEBB_010267 [Seison nebaliae]